MPPLLSRIHSLQLWHLLLVVLAVPPPGTWSLRSRGPAAPRPLCTRRSPSAPRSICIWERTSQPERDSRSDSGSDSRSAVPRQRAMPARGAELRHVVRLRRQAAGARPATPSGFEDGMPSSQYPWAIVWGPTVSDEDGGDTNSANPGFPPLGYTFVSPHGMATAQPNSHSLLHNAGLNLRETPATLRPFLFGPRGEGKSALRCFHSQSPAGAAPSAKLIRNLPCPAALWGPEGAAITSPTPLSRRCGPPAVRHHHHLHNHCPGCHWNHIQVLLGPKSEAPASLGAAEQREAAGEPAAPHRPLPHHRQHPGALRRPPDPHP
uniref:PILR alpha associated neural protein n=1 Tax=Junco hyemalis TaxID=40217 RepID=A0A8C5J2P3_JUNHY